MLETNDRKDGKYYVVSVFIELLVNTQLTWIMSSYVLTTA